MAKLPDDRLKDEVVYYVLHCVTRVHEASASARKPAHAQEAPSASAIRDWVAASAQLAIVSAHFPVAPQKLRRLTARDLRRSMVAALEECTRRLMSQARGAHHTGQMNSTDAMHRTYAAIEMSQWAQFVHDWAEKV